MLKAMNIQTGEQIATHKDRKQLMKIASNAVGNEGYFIRSVIEEKIVLPENWCETEGKWWI